MKNIQTIRTCLLCVLGVSTLALVGCNKSDRAEAHADANKAMAKAENAMDRAVDKTKDVAADMKAGMSNAWADLKSYSYEKKEDFTASAKAMSSKFEAEMSSLKSDYSDAKASASRKAAMADLKDSRANFDTKMSALGKATSATWDSAKAEVVEAWDRVQASYYKAKASH